MQKLVRYFIQFTIAVLIVVFNNALVLAQEIPTEALDNAMKNGDTVLLEKLLDNELTWIHSNGYTQNKKTVIEDCASKKISYDEIKALHIEESKRLKEDIVSIQRLIEVKGYYELESFEIKLKVLELWVKRENEWKLYNRWGVKIKE